MHEYYYRHTFAAITGLIAAVDKWMVRYNARRRHSTIGRLSPIAYTQALDAVTQAASPLSTFRGEAHTSR
jgi:putative transposase